MLSFCREVICQQMSFVISREEETAIFLSSQSVAFKTERHNSGGLRRHIFLFKIAYNAIEERDGKKNEYIPLVNSSP